MAHTHPISDDDKLFVVNPNSRAITYSGDDIVLIKGDHNSEIFSFEVPRIIEGHDMSLCNQIRIHFSNTDRRKRNESKDVYYVTDCTVNDEVIILRWLVSGNATKYCGILTFLIQFCCLEEDGTYSYIWSTDTYNGISVYDSYNNSEYISDEYSDVIGQIFLKLESISDLQKKPKLHIIDLPVSNWTGSNLVYSQTVTVSGIDKYSQVDLRPSPAQLQELLTSEISLTASNDNGTVVVFAIGGKPTSDYSMQIIVSEVDVV